MRLASGSEPRRGGHGVIDLTELRYACADDLGQVVAIHMRAFQGFLMTRLGPRFLRAYYSLVLTTRSGIGVVAEVDRQQAGFVVGYVDPVAFYRELRAKKFRLAVAMIPGLVRDPVLLRHVYASFRRADPKGTGVRDGLSELASVAVDPAYGGQGLGSQLVRSFVEEVRRRGARGVYLTTDAQGNDAVNRFYHKLGFTCVRTFQAAKGRMMNEYQLIFERGPKE